MRIKWLDNLRAIAIFFVVLGHTPGLNEYVEKIIFSFHMPVFFYISGLMCRQDIQQDIFTVFTKKRAEKLLIPYLFFSLVSYTAWFFIFRHFGSQAELSVPPLIPLLGIAYGNGIHHWLVHNTVLWFFLCLFVTEMLFFFMIKIKSRFYILIVLILFSILGYVNVWFNPPAPSGFRLPWNIDIALTAVVFYGAGFLSARYVLKKGEKKTNNGLKRWAFMGSLLCCYVTLSLINDKVAMVAGVYGNYFYFYSAAFTGILFWKAVSEQLSDMWGIRILSRVGQNTLVIFTLHLLVFPLLTGVQVYILKIPAAVKHDSMILSFVYAVITIAVLLPVSDMMNRYLPYLIASRK